MDWILAEQALPRIPSGKRTVEVLVAIAGAKTATTLFFDGSCFMDEGGDTYRVTHWMPLPEMPICEWKKRMLSVFLCR